MKKLAILLVFSSGCAVSTAATPPEVECRGAGMDSNHACGALVEAADAQAASVGCVLANARLAADNVCRSRGAVIDGCLDAVAQSATCAEIEDVLRRCAACAQLVSPH